MHDNIIKTVVITGGNRGIGLDIVKKFAKEHYAVVVGARDTSIFHTLGMMNVYSINFDTTKQCDHVKLVDYAIEKTGRVDCFINNAGFSKWLPIEKIDDEFLDEIISTNLKGYFWGCKAALNKMNHGAVIINISSIAGKRGSSNNTAYCATKFGINGLTQALAKEVGKRGIRVNAVCPVLVKTKGLCDALNADYSPANGNVDLFLNKFTNDQSALGVLPTGKNIADMCFFLASEQSSAITGQCINVDCGVLPQ